MKSNILQSALLLLFSVTLLSPLNSQVSVESGTNITIESGTTVDVTGNLVNNGTIGGKGTLNASGTYTHNGTLAISIGPNANTHTTFGIGEGFIISSGGFTVTTESYSPSNGDQATIISSSGSITGTFSNTSSNQWNANYDIPSDGDFTISYGTALPVDFIFFAGEVLEKEVHLHWQTASQYNSAGFQLQRSSDGKAWHDIAFIDSHETTNKDNVYSFIDELPLPGINYYRLKVVDYDGGRVYSKMISVEVDVKSEFIGLYPNPAKNSVTVSIGSEYVGLGSLTLYDLTGRQVKKQVIALEGSPFRSEIGLDGLQPGVYLTEVTAGLEQWQERLIIE